MKAPKLAQEVASRYLRDVDDSEPHAANIQKHLRGPVQALTLYLLQLDENAHDEEPGTEAMPAPEEEKKSTGSCSPGNGASWRDYLATTANAASPILSEVNQGAYDALGRRTKARLEGFLTSIALAVTEEPVPKSRVTSATSLSSHDDAPSEAPKDPMNAKARAAISLAQGLAGFQGSKEKNASAAKQQPNIFRSVSTQSSSSNKPSKYPQMSEDRLLIRLELYIRSLCRAKAQGQECVISAEPPRAMKARVRAIVLAFVDTVDNVQQQSIVLSRLITAHTQELLAVEYLSEKLTKLIRRLISDYVQSVSFASLAFLSSPETSADQRLTPMLMKYFRFLQINWRDCVAECELERMLALSIDPTLRRTLKHIEFRSIGHLLEVCQGFRSELHQIALAPDMRAGGPDAGSVENNDAVRQALRDLQREVISVNGNILPPVTSRKDLISLLSQTLNSRTLTSTTSGPIKPKRKSARKPSRLKQPDTAMGNVKSGDELTTSGDETDLSGYTVDVDKSRPDAGAAPGSLRRRRSFRLSTIDFLTKRLLLAASRTGTGGDAYFVVRDLFGGDDVEVVPSQHVYAHGRNVRPGSIEIIVKLASVTIKCHGSFDVYPRSMVGDCEPLIQLHTTTAETIALQEVRAGDSCSDAGSMHDDYNSDESDYLPVMVVQERKTENTGWRYITIRPALYEKYAEFSTPS